MRSSVRISTAIAVAVVAWMGWTALGPASRVENPEPQVGGAQLSSKASLPQRSGPAGELAGATHEAGGSAPGADSEGRSERSASGGVSADATGSAGAASPDGRGQALLVVSGRSGDPLPSVSIKVIGREVPRPSHCVTDQAGLATAFRNERSIYILEAEGYAKRTLRASDLPAVSADGPAVVELREYAKVSGQMGVAGPNERAAPVERGRPVYRGLPLQGGVVVRAADPGDRRRLVDQQGRIAPKWSVGVEVPGVLTDVGADGRWAMTIAVPYGVDALQQLSIEHVLADGSARVLGEAALLLPGDDLVVDDPWQHEEPVELGFDGEDACAVAQERTLRLWRANRGGSRAEAEVTRLLSGTATVWLDRLPEGEWSYAVEAARRGFPPEWLPRGTFVRSRGANAVTLEWGGSACRVDVHRLDAAAKGLFRIGVVPRGEQIQAGRLLRVGERWVVPQPADGGLYDVVVEASRSAVSWKGSRKLAPRVPPVSRAAARDAARVELARLPFVQGQPVLRLQVP